MFSQIKIEKRQSILNFWKEKIKLFKKQDKASKVSEIIVKTLEEINYLREPKQNRVSKKIISKVKQVKSLLQNTIKG